MLNLDDNVAIWRNRDIGISARQLRIVALLSQHPGKFYSPAQIYDAFWDREMRVSEKAKRINSRVLIKRLREAFRRVDRKFNMIETRATIGYRWIIE